MKEVETIKITGNGTLTFEKRDNAIHVTINVGSTSEIVYFVNKMRVIINSEERPKATIEKRQTKEDKLISEEIIKEIGKLEE